MEEGDLRLMYVLSYYVCIVWCLLALTYRMLKTFEINFNVVLIYLKSHQFFLAFIKSKFFILQVLSF